MFSEDIQIELASLEKKYSLCQEEILPVMQNVLSTVLNRPVFIASENDFLNLLRINKNGTASKIMGKSIKKSKILLIDQLEQLSYIKHCEKLISMFKIGDYVEGEILDKTNNGYFISIKNQRAFMPLKKSFASEASKGLYHIHNKLSFVVEKIESNKIYVTRNHPRIFNEIISSIVYRQLKIKLIENKLFIYCNEPYLNEAQKEMLQSSLPLKVILKKDKLNASSII